MYLLVVHENRLRCLLLFACALMVFSFYTCAASAQNTPTSVTEIKNKLLVVYNENAPEARELAFQYALARKLDRTQILAIQCPTDEEISRIVFDQQIRTPIRQHMLERGLLTLSKARINFGSSVKEVQVAQENKVWSMVLIRGIPLKIKNDPAHIPPENLPPQFRKNEAAVDSELSLIMYDPIELSGFVPNPYYSESNLRPFSSKLALSLIMVARLDGPSVSDVQRMIRDAVETEKLELTGKAYFDARGIIDQNSGYRVGDEWIRYAYAYAKTSGLEVYLDDSEPILKSSLPIEDVALYAGWYREDFTGPFERKDFQFRPGAVAYHLHSFSANTLRSTTKHWSGPLIAKGATATMGSVYEPYLRLTPNLRTFFNSLLAGQCFAEAAYQSQAGLSWMITMVGDPLYRPFPRSTIESAKLAQQNKSEEAPWLCLRVARQICQKNIPRTEKIDRITRMVNALPSHITYEGLGLMLKDLDAPKEQIIAALRKAESMSPTIVGKIRNGLHLADFYISAGSISETMAEYERLLATYPEAARNFEIPDLALTYAAKNGWNQFSPELQTFLAPVGETPADVAQSQGAETSSNTPAPNTNGIPVAPRKDLIPQKPNLAPPKSGPEDQLPHRQNPHKLKIPGS